MALPVKTTIDDVDQVVSYLKNKPAGATLAEAKAVITAKPLDGRKMKAYTQWGLLREEGGKQRLTDLGRELARSPEKSEGIYRQVVDRIRPYRAAIEWAHHQGFDKLTVNEVAAYWIDHFASEVGTTNEASVQAAVTCFFNLADAANLGRYVLGRGTNPTRLELQPDNMKAFVESGPIQPPWEGDPLESPEGTTEESGEDPGDSSDDDGVEDEQLHARVQPELPDSSREESPPLRVFIAHGKNMDIVEQVETILGLADIDSEYAEAEESPAIPVPEKVLTAMRSCSAGIICVSVDEGSTDSEGNYKINENVLIEIGAAFVLYDQRVVLLWDRRLPVPSNLQGLYRCEFEGDELNWSAGMKLMKAIKSFKR